MRILIAEDESDVLHLYKKALERRGHEVIIANDGEEAHNKYHNSLGQAIGGDTERIYNSTFDVVVLDHKMPKKNGMEVAKLMLESNPRQRVIFASAFVKDTLLESVKTLDQVVELIQKPFELKTLVDVVENMEVYSKLQKFNINVPKLKSLGLGHEQLVDLMEHVSEIMKQKIA